MPVNPELVPLPTIKKWAKTLQKTLPEVVPSAETLSLSQSQEILARLLSYKNWHALNSTYKTPPQSSHITNVQSFEDLFQWAKKTGLGRLSLSIDLRTADSTVHVFDSLLNTKDIIFSFPLNSKDFSAFLMTFIDHQSECFGTPLDFIKRQFLCTTSFSKFSASTPIWGSDIYQETLLHFPYNPHPFQKQLTIFLNAQEERLHQKLAPEIASFAKRIKSSIRSLDSESVIFQYASFSPEALEQDLWQLAESIGSPCGAMIGPHRYMNLSASFYPADHLNLKNVQHIMDNHDVLIFNTDLIDIDDDLLLKLISQGKTIVLAGVCSNRLLFQSKQQKIFKKFSQMLSFVFCYYDNSSSPPAIIREKKALE